MTSEYSQSNEELQQHLIDILQALELSASAFDRGCEGEAKRLAAAIRVLVHDTNNSKSLLYQLGRKSMQFYDTSIPRHLGTILTYNGITAMDITSQGALYVAPLDELSPESSRHYISFDQWWNAVIFVDEAGRETTRKDLILAVANKDGGAHIDPVLDEKYASLSRHNSLVWQFSSPRGNLPLKGPEKSAIRQIAHEMLRSFNPAMPNLKPKIQGVLTMGVYATAGKEQLTIPRVGRNKICPCGSGKKYKKCHGRT